eukprot:5407961-Pyramimonas_sp.AAC.1
MAGAAGLRPAPYAPRAAHPTTGDLALVAFPPTRQAPSADCIPIAPCWVLDCRCRHMALLFLLL